MKKRYVAVPIVCIVLAVLLAFASVGLLTPFPAVHCLKDPVKQRKQVAFAYRLTHNMDTLSFMLQTFYEPVAIEKDDTFSDEEKAELYQRGISYYKEFIERSARQERGEIVTITAIREQQFYFHPNYIYMLYLSGDYVGAEREARSFLAYLQTESLDIYNFLQTPLQNILKHEDLSKENAAWIHDIAEAVLNEYHSEKFGDIRENKAYMAWMEIAEKSALKEAESPALNA